MRVKGEAYSAGTILNAIATLKGVAFGIDLKTTVYFEESDERGFYILQEGKKKRDAIAEKLMRNSEFEGGIFRVESEIPMRSGLGSSSAFMNALILTAFKAQERELLASRILKLNARMSLEAGMSYTGAFDDASASLLGGVVFSDNLKMKLFKREELEEKEILILIPEWKRGDVDVKKLRSNFEDVERAFRLAMGGKFREAMFLNSLHYCAKLELPLDPVFALQNLKISAGLSGNGPTYVAFGDDIDKAKEIWENYGRVIRRRTINEPVEDVIVDREIFF